jgi:hypothetical protein
LASEIDPNQLGHHPERLAGEPDITLGIAEKINLVQWHLDRYDRLRASTASRASVVLSAGAILSAGNAVVLSQLLGNSATQVSSWLLAIFTVAAMASAFLIVLSLIRASNVLVTPRDSRRMFSASGALPKSLVFNGTDTVEHVASFDEFRTVVEMQGGQAILEAAEVELWVGIQQHRHRYIRLRGAVRLLRHAAVTFMAILATAMIVNLVSRF